MVGPTGCVHEERAIAERYAIDALSRTYAQDFSRLVGKYAFAGTPHDVVARLQDFGEAGAETIVVSFACPHDYVDEGRHLFAAEVLPALGR